MTLDVLECEVDGLGVELRVGEKRQLAEPEEPPLVAREETTEPIRNRHADDALAAGRVEDDGVERAKPRVPPSGMMRGRPPLAHVDQGWLTGKLLAKLPELRRRGRGRHLLALTMLPDEHRDHQAHQEHDGTADPQNRDD